MGDIKMFYPEFVPNQILTNTQLNQLREHLEDRELHTRLRLTGTGIVCGFHWTIVTSPKPAIKLSGGYGISSDGELIEQCDPAEYTHRRPYADPDKDETGALRYLPWRNPADSTHKTQRDIIELIDKERMAGTDKPEDATALTAANLTGTAPITTNRVLVLYLEHEPVDLNSCLVTSCDNKGLNINVRVRALLVKESDLTRAADCADAPMLERAPRMHTVRRPQEITDAAALENTFGSIVVARAPSIGARIKVLFDTHAAFLDVENFTVADPLAGKLNGTQSAPYRHDALADFACAYNEAALAVYSLIEQCCPAGDFPRHLMLGALDGSPLYRNEFLPAPVRNVARGEFEQVRMLFLRLRAMLNALNFGSYPAEVAIQPSHTPAFPLGRRARPYYFASIALDYWRPRPRCAVDPDWPWRRPVVDAEFKTDYAEPTWLRIEGHVGQSHIAANTQIREKRDAENVEFCLLRTYFIDRLPEEKTLREAIAAAQVNLLKVDSKTWEAVAQIVVKGDGDFAPIAKQAKVLFDLYRTIDTKSAAWIAERDQRVLHCDWSALGRDYLEARNELVCIAARLLGMLQRLRLAVDMADAKVLIGSGLDAMRDSVSYMLVDRIVGAIVADPRRWSKPELIKAYLDWSVLPKLNDLERLRIALRVGLDVLATQGKRMLEETLPKSLAHFDYEVFAARLRELIRGLLEFRMWIAVLGTVLTGANNGQPIKDGDAPLHEVEAGNIEADLLAMARSCLAARLSAVFSAYEALRAKDPSLYRNLAQVDGLEHLAGVAKGGTFVLLCDTSTGSGKVLADFSLESCLPCCCELDPDAICLPPLALPDVRVVKLVPDGKGGYLPVQLSISVGANDYDPNGVGKVVPKVRIELLAEKSERGATLDANSETAAVTYGLANPVPGVIDRFRYRLKVEGDCSGEAIGDVVVVFAVDPLITGKMEGTVFNVGRDGVASGATVRIVGTALETLADSKGRFSFDLLPPGAYSVQAILGNQKSAIESVTVVANATTIVELVLQATLLNGMVVVRVFGPQETPIPNAAVTLKTESGSFTQTIPTDASGDSVFQNVPIGNCSVVVRAQGFITNGIDFFPLTGGQTSIQIVRLQTAGGTTPTLDVTHTVGTLGINTIEATKLVRNTFANRYAKVVDVFNQVTVDPKVLASNPYEMAATFLGQALSDPTKSDTQIAADYKETSAALATAAKQASGATRIAYQELLSATSVAYLDYIAASNPTALTPEASAEVKTVSSALKIAGVSPGTVQVQWDGVALGDKLGIGTVPGIGALLA